MLLVPVATAWAAARPACLESLDALEVPYERAPPREGIAVPVEVTGPLGGVTYTPVGRARPLVLDCSLVYSLALAGRYFVEEGLLEAVYTDSYNRRFVHGTRRWSKHAFGLALDVHFWRDATQARVSVAHDYQKGLGRGRDCLGRPADDDSRRLRLVWCRLVRSELFRLVLDPDYDEGHRDHFHIQAPAWNERTDLEWRAGR